MAIEKIVVVDDEMMIRKALETQLRNERYSVASTADLKGARKILVSGFFWLGIFRLISARGRKRFDRRHYIKNRWSCVHNVEV